MVGKRLMRLSISKEKESKYHDSNMLNYEVLANIYQYRKDHKLDEWKEFCKWIEGLPWSEIITKNKR